MREVYSEILDSVIQDFPSGSGVKNPPANEGDTGLIPGLDVPTWSRELGPCATVKTQHRQN